MKAIEKFIQNIGKDKVITDPDVLDAYSSDETSDLKGAAEILIRAANTSDVSAALGICYEYGLSVIPRGSGSGVTGGAVPVNGGVVLSLEKMNRILEIDSRNMVAVVEPGAITAEIQREARSKGLYYPPDPASLDMCSIGGNVAENAGGPAAVKYGTTKDYILGIEFVLPDGTVIETGGKNIKNATGYNLSGIIAGSEGTLAVITKIYLKLIPYPAVIKDLLIPFESIEKAIGAVADIFSANILPSAIEFMEEDAIRLVAKHLNYDIPFPDAGAHLLIRLDGSNEDAVVSDMERIARAVKVDENKIIAAESDIQRDRLWKARRGIRNSIEIESPVFLAEDSVVPRGEIASFILSVKELLEDISLSSVMFGHAGDGNVHIDVLKRDMNYERWRAMIPQIREIIYKTAISCGGTITGEHGIGYLRKNYLSLALSQDEIDLMKRIKKAFDPRGILNPGKIFP